MFTLLQVKCGANTPETKEEKLSVSYSNRLQLLMGMVCYRGC